MCRSVHRGIWAIGVLVGIVACGGERPEARVARVASAVESVAIVPIELSGNVSCADLNMNPAYVGITSDFGFKIDQMPLVDDPPYLFTSSYGILTGGFTGDANRWVDLSNITGYSFDWVSSHGIDAVIVKGGTNSNSYVYFPEATSGFAQSPDNSSGGAANISHVEFCFDIEKCENVTCDGATACMQAGVCNEATGLCEYQPKPTTTVCRAAASLCDAAEYCDANGACPDDALVPAGTACGDSSDSVCDNPDTCDAAGVCQPNYEASTVICRADGGACDVAEYCDGAGACPADALEPVGTACGSTADTICDNPDTCDATGACQPNYEPVTTLCREDAGTCDVAEYCDAMGSCPIDGHEPVGTLCGDASDTVCDNPDTCSADGLCLSNLEPAGTICRVDAGACDVAETCTGTSALCPPDSFEPAGTACGDSTDTVCDNPDTCNATGLCLVNHEPLTTTCRADAGECDVPETCNAEGLCPADTFEPLGTACGSPASGVCDNPDTCDAAGACLVNHEPITTICRTDAGECDVPETCNAEGVCPADAFEPLGTACGSGSDTVCDNPDTCDATGACLVNHEPLTTICRSDAGECDVPETCDAEGVCPANGFEPAGTACGDPEDSVCDDPDTCNGTGACLVNHEALTTICREDGGECDVPETCDAEGLCPADAFEPVGTACGSPASGICDNPDTCDAAGVCLVNHEPTTKECRADAGDCDVPELCNAEGTCPVDAFEPNGTACGSADDTVCDNPDTCDATGVCLVNHEPTTKECRAGAGDCDVPESCTAEGTCAIDTFKPATFECRASGGECDPAELCTGTTASCPNDVLLAAGTTCRESTDEGQCDPAEVCTGTAAACPTDVLATCTLCGGKFYDADIDGLWADTELGIEGWRMELSRGPETLYAPAPQPLYATTNDVGAFEFTGLAAGNYTLCEATPLQTNWLQTAPESCFDVTVPSAEASACGLDFGNVCFGAGGGHTPGFWGNKIGEAEFGKIPGAIGIVQGLNLWNANGTEFNPTTWRQLATWLRNAEATNMAYMLSAHLASIRLNVAAGFVDADALIYAPGLTTLTDTFGFVSVQDVLAAANTALLDGFTPAGDPNRALQEQLKIALDRANNNLSFLQTQACPFTFASLD